jgi:hypothetical protein
VDVAEKYERHLQNLLEPGEDLRGICIATQQSLFKGRAIAVGVTGRRLLLQPLDRRGEPNGQPTLLVPGDIRSAEVDGAGGGWFNVGPAILDATAAALKLHLQNGEKLRLMMMRGGTGVGRLGGGEAQQRGVQALADWFAQAAPPT